MYDYLHSNGEQFAPHGPSSDVGSLVRSFIDLLTNVLFNLYVLYLRVNSICMQNVSAPVMLIKAVELPTPARPVCYGSIVSSDRSTKIHFESFLCQSFGELVTRREPVSDPMVCLPGPAELWFEVVFVWVSTVSRSCTLLLLLLLLLLTHR